MLAAGVDRYCLAMGNSILYLGLECHQAIGSFWRSIRGSELYKYKRFLTWDCDWCSVVDVSELLLDIVSILSRKESIFDSFLMLRALFTTFIGGCHSWSWVWHSCDKTLSVTSCASCWLKNACLYRGSKYVAIKYFISIISGEHLDSNSSSSLRANEQIVYKYNKWLEIPCSNIFMYIVVYKSHHRGNKVVDIRPKRIT